MDEYEISCIYYPTTVVVVDDNESVLENILLKVGKNIPCKIFSDPKEGLAYIKKTLKKADILSDIIGVNESSVDYSHESNRFPIQYDLKKIFQHASDKQRFQQISVLVIDYAMPGMNGEELCRALKRAKGNPVKIIMLTGEIDEPMAVRLFNEGLIDRFLRKARPGVDEELKNCIIEMQRRYFQDLTYPIIRGIISDKDSALGDPAFREFFNKICQQVSASSYYLIETSGSFIFFNNAGKPKWLLVRTLDELKEISEQIEADISEDLIASIGKGEFIPYFGSLEKEIECYEDEEKLRKSLHKAEKLRGKKTYCYALLDELPGFPLETKNFVSFDEYMSGL